MTDLLERLLHTPQVSHAVVNDNDRCHCFSSFILHPSSFILHPSSFILHPSSFILHPSSFILHPSSFILHPSSFILHPSSFILHPSSFILHPSSFILYPFLSRRVCELPVLLPFRPVHCLVHCSRVGSPRF